MNSILAPRNEHEREALATHIDLLLMIGFVKATHLFVHMAEHRKLNTEEKEINEVVELLTAFN